MSPVLITRVWRRVNIQRLQKHLALQHLKQLWKRHCVNLPNFFHHIQIFHLFELQTHIFLTMIKTNSFFKMDINISCTVGINKVLNALLTISQAVPNNYAVLKGFFYILASCDVISWTPLSDSLRIKKSQNKKP